MLEITTSAIVKHLSSVQPIQKDQLVVTEVDVVAVVEVETHLVVVVAEAETPSVVEVIYFF